MKRRIRITSIRREPVNTGLLAQALIELVRYQEEQQRTAKRSKAKRGRE
jgi:hypothetical protein